jgi:hypothetical protein
MLSRRPYSDDRRRDPHSPPRLHLVTAMGILGGQIPLRNRHEVPSLVFSDTFELNFEIMRITILEDNHRGDSVSR